MTALAHVNNVCKTLATTEFKARLSQALPPNVSVDRFTRTAITALQMNPDLADADRTSLYNAVTKAAQDGLLPDGREGALVIFKTKLRGPNGQDVWTQAVQWMPMMAGVVKRLANAGVTIETQLVHENDEFEQQLGDDAKITHKAPKLGQPRGEIVGVYAIARTRDGMVFREVMDRDQVEQVRKASRSPDKGPWGSWWGEMARKTVLRRLAKRLPLGDGEVDLVTRDDEMYGFTDTPEPPAPRRPDDVPSSLSALVPDREEATDAETVDDDRRAEQAAASNSEAPEDDF